MDGEMGSKDGSMSSVSGTTVQTIDVDKTQIAAEIVLSDTSLEEGKTAKATFKLIYKKAIQHAIRLTVSSGFLRMTVLFP